MSSIQTSLVCCGTPWPGWSWMIAIRDRARSTQLDSAPRITEPIALAVPWALSAETVPVAVERWSVCRSSAPAA